MSDDLRLRLWHKGAMTGLAVPVPDSAVLMRPTGLRDITGREIDLPESPPVAYVTDGWATS